MATKYEIGGYLKQMTTLLEVSPARVLQRAGLSATLVNDEELFVGPETYFKLWDALCAEVDRDGIELELAMAYAHGPFLPPIFAFSCAETLGLGLQRLCDFKPLIGPVKMQVTKADDTLTVSISPSEPRLSIPLSMGALEILYITECARTFTGKKIWPVGSTLPGAWTMDAEGLSYLGKSPSVGEAVSLTFQAEDANLPLITRSASLWESLEPRLQEQLHAQTETTTMSGRIKHALMESLPGGSTSVEFMARRLNISKRSLQRRLSEEGTSFQDILNQTRFEMSERFLKDSGLSVPEISYLLGFRETSSFFRAFQGWTGTTPGEYRASSSAADRPRLN